MAVHQAVVMLRLFRPVDHGAAMGGPAAIAAGPGVAVDQAVIVVVVLHGHGVFPFLVLVSGLAQCACAGCLPSLNCAASVLVASAVVLA